MRAATVVQVLQDLFCVLLHVLFYFWSLLNWRTAVQDPRSRWPSVIVAHGSTGVDRFTCWQCAVRWMLYMLYYAHTAYAYHIIYDNNFIARMLYKDVYWLYSSRYYIWLSMCCFLYLYVHNAFCHRVFKRIWMNEWMNEYLEIMTPSIDAFLLEE